MVGAELLDDLPHLRRAGEGHEVDARMRCERGPRAGAAAGHDVDGALRESGLVHEVSQRQRRRAGILRGLEHGGVAHREGRGKRAPEHLRGIVPGQDVAGHPVRLVRHGDEVAVEVRDGLAVQLVGGPAVELEVAGERDDVGLGDARGLAGVAGLDGREALGVALDQRAEPDQEAAAVERRGAAPGTVVERLPGRRDGAVDILRRAVGDGADGRAGGRLVDVEDRLAGRPGPLATDEVQGSGHGSVLLRKTSLAARTACIRAPRDEAARTTTFPRCAVCGGSS